jgi:hypothetical protein
VQEGQAKNLHEIAVNKGKGKGEEGEGICK